MELRGLMHVLPMILMHSTESGPRRTAVIHPLYLSVLHPPWRSDDTSWGTNHTNKASQQDFLLCWNLNYFVLHALLPSILFEFVLALSQALVDQCIISHCIPIGQLVVSSHTVKCLSYTSGTL